MTAKFFEERVDARRWIKLERKDDAIPERDLMLDNEAEHYAEERQVENCRVEVQVRQKVSQVSLKGAVNLAILIELFT